MVEYVLGKRGRGLHGKGAGDLKNSKALAFRSLSFDLTVTPAAPSIPPAFFRIGNTRKSQLRLEQIFTVRFTGNSNTEFQTLLQ